ncbi:MAG TPA: SAM-dependent methyltransferase [Actinophytocola sp.]|uniref:SAM-dependent methyltransferase n=1 Tax=Actinophytocola sp. TaxID=1872138 RepID=UPI002DDD54A2|nr:SAM-dependent methyltransferase [Actinophytocola sp.]HEV2782635.1 SAM-dependent methyltransferase [Actinophytocola sp.]
MPAERPSWAPQHIDLDKPNAARVYDYFLGGACNFEIDRQFAENFLTVMPEIELVARRNRAFLRRAVRFCVDQGIRQFLDIGSGIPTVGNVHQIAQQMAPECRVLYVDNEPVAVAHSELMLEHNPNAAVLQADLRDPATVLGSESARQLLDFDAPMALLMVAVLHFVPESAHPRSAIEQYLKALAPGSLFVVSHVSIDDWDGEQSRPGVPSYNQTTTPVYARTRQQVLELMAGTELVAPGLVWAQDWRADPSDDVDDKPKHSFILAGVGRKS